MVYMGIIQILIFFSILISQYFIKRQIQMTDTRSVQDLSNCSNCSKNDSLVKKYEELIKLYRKKQAKLSFSASRVSNIPTTSNTLELQTLELHCKKMVDVLAHLMKKRCSPLFRFSSSKSAKKFLVLNLCNRISKSAKVKAFKNLKLLLKQQSKQCLSLVGQNFNLDTNTLDQKAYKIEFPVIQQHLTQITDQNMNKEGGQAKTSEWLSEIKRSLNGEFEGYKNIQRRNMQLQIKNKKLNAENQYLRQEIQDLNKRIVKQNQKKEENIAAFSEEMTQKIEQIEELKQMLKQYEQAHPASGNVLESEVISLRKDLEDLNNLNKRLNEDLSKVKDQLVGSNKNIKIFQQNKIKLQKENYQLHKSAFEMNLNVQKYEKNTEQYTKLIKLMEKKMKRLNIYEKQIEESISNGRIACQKTESTNCLQQFKSEIILMYLTNISDSEYKLHSSHLFDSQEKNFLSNHKQAWINLQNEVKNKKMNKNNHEMFQISEILPKDDQMISVLENMEIMEPHDMRKKEGTTMRIIQLQLEIKKHIQKIGQLKQEFLHLRVVILNLLKSLELQNPLPATKDILRVLFDIFQYSEKERQNIYVKKRKMFGFI